LAGFERGHGFLLELIVFNHGNGDLLYLSASSPKPKRIQGVFVSESEVKRVVKFIKDQKEERGEEEIGENIVEIGSTLSLMSLKGLLTESGGKYYLSK